MWNVGTAFWQGSSGSSWTPASLPGLVAWYDASNIPSITAPGGLVNHWNDLSGGGNHLVQGLDANKFISGAITQNGLNCFSTPVGGARMAGPHTYVQTAAGKYAFAVWGNSDAAVGGTLITVDPAAPGASTNYALTLEAGSGGLMSNSNPSGYTAVTIGAASHDGAAHLVGWYAINGSSPITATAFFDATTTSNTNAFGFAFVGIGDYPNNAFYLKGRVCEIFLGDSTVGLTSDQVTSARAYLKNKWATP
jgi:hypothetical protein